MACDSIEATFQALAEEWRRDTSHLSWTSMRVQHPAYLKIIAMGSDVLPLLLRELQEGHCPSDWLWVLRAITGAIGPTIPKEDLGRVRRIADAWLRWEHERSLRRALAAMLPEAARPKEK
jgi:hypothetical protein